MALQNEERRTSGIPCVLIGPPTIPGRNSITRAPMLITQQQKQNIIDNLQQEITQRARKLRAQYADQALSLRSRVEIRINRVPKNLRTVTMGELLKSHAKHSNPVPEESFNPPVNTVNDDTTQRRMSGVVIPAQTKQPRGTKRSSEFMIAVDEENESESTHDLPNPKKRTKTTGVAQSRQVTHPASVLSPKSSNSRTLITSPIRSPQKAFTSRPVSPLKPALLGKTGTFTKNDALAATRSLATLVEVKSKPGRPAAGTGTKTSKSATEPKATVTRAKRGAPQIAQATEVRTASSASNTSAGSMTTTIVKQTRKPAPAAKPAAKKGVGISAAGKKVASSKPEVATTGRVLRKRA